MVNSAPFSFSLNTKATTEKTTVPSGATQFTIQTFRNEIATFSAKTFLCLLNASGQEHPPILV